MGKQKRPAAQPQFGKEKKQKGPAFIPLPEAGSDEEVELSDEDLQFVSSHYTDLSFLEKLPKKDIDRAVSQVKKGPPPKPATQQAQRQGASVAGQGGGGGGEEGREGSGSDEELLDSDEGEDYERRPRLHSKGKEDRKKPAGLPVKTLDGEVVFQRPGTAAAAVAAAAAAAAAAPAQLAVAGVTIEDDLEEALRREREKERERREAEEAAAAEAAREEASRSRAAAAKTGRLSGHPADGGVLAELAAYADAAQRREAAKRTMAAAAQALLANPEGRLAEVKPILELLGDKDAQVRRLAMLTGVAVFKDILPGYRIRPPTEKELEVVVSKEVQRMRDYEQALLRAYQALLKALLEAAQLARSGQQPVQHGRIAVKCMASLLVALPHFNYTSDLLQALVPHMAHKDQQTRELACGSVRAVVSNDREGVLTVEATQLVADLVKRRKCVVAPAVVQALLGLTFSEIGNAEEFEDAKRRQRGRAKKKSKKKGGERDDVEKGFEESQAMASAEVRRGYQSQTLEALFELFFRVLKACTASGLIAQRDGSPLPSSRFSKKFPLLFPTLEGLSKYAHLISVDYFSDLMSVLQQLLESSALPPAERLRCLLTVSQILKGQGEALTVDRRSFYTQLYTALLHASLAPLLEGEEQGEGEGEAEGGEGRAAGPAAAAGRGGEGGSGSSSVGGAATPPGEQVGYLLALLLESMILESKLLDVTRQAAFAKRMAATAAAGGDTGMAMGLLCVLHRMLRRQPKLRGMLENEAGGPSGYKTYQPAVDDPAEAGALSVPLWELSLLAQHFHPHVTQAAKGVAGMASPEGAGGAGVLPIGASAAELAALYSTASGGFRPAPVAAQAAARKKAGSKRAPAGSSEAAVAGGAAGLEAFLTAVQWGAARDGLFPRRHGAEAVGSLAATVALGPAAAHGTAAVDAEGEGMLSLPGWGVGDAVEGSSGEEEEGGGAGGTQGGPGEGRAAGAASHALLRHFRLARSFQRNAELRREAALGRARLARFQQHLAERQQEVQRAQRAQQELEARRACHREAARQQARAAKKAGLDGMSEGRGSAGSAGSGGMLQQKQQQQQGKKQRAGATQGGAAKAREGARAAVRAAPPRRG